MAACHYPLPNLGLRPAAAPRARRALLASYPRLARLPPAERGGLDRPGFAQRWGYPMPSVYRDSARRDPGRKSHSPRRIPTPACKVVQVQDVPEACGDAAQKEGTSGTVVDSKPLRQTDCSAWRARAAGMWRGGGRGDWHRYAAPPDERRRQYDAY